MFSDRRKDAPEEHESLEVKDRRRFTADGERRDDGDADASVDPFDTDAPGALELEQAEARAVAAETKLAEFREAFARYKEEQEAARARLERDKDRRVRDALGRSYAGILDALDGLDRALEHADPSPLADGVTLVRHQILEVLAREGVEKMQTVGHPFDPTEHEALMATTVDDPESHDRVLNEIRPGYRFGDVVLRAAQVQVGKHSG